MANERAEASTTSATIPYHTFGSSSGARALDVIRGNSCHERTMMCAQGIWQHIKDCGTDSISTLAFVVLAIVIIAFCMLGAVVILRIQDARAKRRGDMRDGLVGDDGEAGLFGPYLDEPVVGMRSDGTFGDDEKELQ